MVSLVTLSEVVVPVQIFLVLSRILAYWAKPMCKKAKTSVPPPPPNPPAICSACARDRSGIRREEGGCSLAPTLATRRRSQDLAAGGLSDPVPHCPPARDHYRALTICMADSFT